MASFGYNKTNISLLFEVGVDEEGNSITKRVTLANVRDTLTADEIRQASLAIAGLVKHTLLTTERIVYEYVDAV